MFDFKEKLKGKLQSLCKETIFDINYWETVAQESEFSEECAKDCKEQLRAYQKVLEGFEATIKDEEFYYQNNKHLDKIL